MGTAGMHTWYGAPSVPMNVGSSPAVAGVGGGDGGGGGMDGVAHSNLTPKMGLPSRPQSVGL